MKRSKISVALMGVVTSATIAYSVTKSDLSYSTDYVAGSGKTVSSDMLNLQTSDFKPQVAWKIFDWKIWDAAGDVLKAGAGAAAGAVATSLIKGSSSVNLVDVAKSMLSQNATAQKEAMLNELN